MTQNFLKRYVKTKTTKTQPLLDDKKFFFRQYSKFSDFGLNTKHQFWPIFMSKLRKPRKIRNTYQILLKMVLFDAAFIEGFVPTNISKNQRV